MDVTQAELIECLHEALGLAPMRIQRFPFGDRVERLRLHLPDGRTLECVVKYGPERELALYRDVLDPNMTGAPRLLGACSARPWFFLEYLPETFPDLSDPGQVDLAFRHLGAVHRGFAGRRPVSAAGRPWPVARDEAIGALGNWGPAAQALFQAGPRTLVHGDYHRWNLVVHGGRVRVLDWEGAHWAHPVWDLALLTPDEPGTDTQPGGAMAEYALRTYHAHGLLSDLPWTELLRLHTLARLFVATHWLLYHERTALSAAFRDVVLQHAERERSRVKRLRALLDRGMTENTD